MKPKRYHIKIKVETLLADQIAENDTRTSKEKLHYQKTEETTKQEKIGDIPIEELPPASEKELKSKKTSTRQQLTHCFQRNNGNLYTKGGEAYGHIKRDIRRVNQCIKKNGFVRQPALDLIRITPEWISLGKEPIDELTEVLEVRNVNHPPWQTREPIYFETVKDRTIEFDLLVSATCPIPLKDIKRLIRGLLDLDGVGASKRGHYNEILEFKKVD